MEPQISKQEAVKQQQLLDEKNCKKVEELNQGRFRANVKRAKSNSNRAANFTRKRE